VPVAAAAAAGFISEILIEILLVLFVLGFIIEIMSCAQRDIGFMCSFWQVLAIAAANFDKRPRAASLSQIESSSLSSTPAALSSTSSSSPEFTRLWSFCPEKPVHSQVFSR
jgi:hypothetical protein